MTGGILPSFLGAKINDIFVNLTMEKMKAEDQAIDGMKDKSLITLHCIKLGFLLLTFPVFFLLPSREDIDEFQK